MSTSYRITLRCTDCGHKWRRTVESPDEADPPCPCCERRPVNIGLDVSAGIAPSIGGNPANKAMDFTLETVAQEYGFTDLRTDARDGETMTPKLPPAQQAAADAMFNPTLRKKTMGSNGNRLGAKLGAMAANAMAGGYSAPAHDPVAALHRQHQQGAKIKANYVVGDGVRPNA
jgi:hypothetical protein